MAEILQNFKRQLENNPALTDLAKPKSQKRLARTENQIAQFDKWQQSRQCFSMLDFLREQFAKQQQSPQKTHSGIDFYGGEMSKSFRFHPALTRFSDTAFGHLFELLKQRLATLDYQPSLSDARVFARGCWDETIQRHRLTASNTEGGQFAQITIELLFKNKGLCTLRLDACIPNTDCPRPTDDFAHLIEALTAY